MATRHRVLLWDIETAPLLAHVWGPRADWVPADRFVHDSFMLSWAAKWEGERNVYSSVLSGDEALVQDDTRIVLELAELVAEADVIVAHNGDRFDLPRLNGRVAKHGLEPLPPVRTIDTLTLARRSFGFSHNTLDHLADELGVPRKLSTGWDLWLQCYHGDEKALAKLDRYCRRDVRVLEAVFQRMRPYVKMPRLVSADYAGEFACTHCGSHDLQRRGTRETAVSTFARYQCNECKQWSKQRIGDPVKLSTSPV